MSDTSKPQQPAAPPKRGEAAWREQRDAIASRNDRASKLARERRQLAYEQQAADRRAAERQERARLARREL